MVPLLFAIAILCIVIAHRITYANSPAAKFASTTISILATVVGLLMSFDIISSNVQEVFGPKPAPQQILTATPTHTPSIISSPPASNTFTKQPITPPPFSSLLPVLYLDVLWTWPTYAHIFSYAGITAEGTRLGNADYSARYLVLSEQLVRNDASNGGYDRWIQILIDDTYAGWIIYDERYFKLVTVYE